MLTPSPTPRPRLRSALVPLTVTALLALTAGCAQDPATTSARATDAASPSGASPGTVLSDDPTPTPSPSPADPTASPSTSSTPPPPGATPAPALASALLGADQLPRPADGVSWRETATGTSEPAVLPVCHRAPLLSVGARSVASRSFGSAEDPTSSATQTMARFVDAVTARRTYTVLRSWHTSCAQRTGLTVTSWTPVDDASGSDEADWYAVTDEAAGTVETVGYLRSGTDVAVVVTRGPVPAQGASETTMPEALRRVGATVAG